MEKENLIKKIADAISVIKNNTNDGVIKDHRIDSLFNFKTGQDVGVAVVLDCGTKYVFPEEFFNDCKEKFGADSFSLEVKKCQLHITFKVYYK